jgi:hypothetical protein
MHFNFESHLKLINDQKEVRHVPVYSCVLLYGVLTSKQLIVCNTSYCEVDVERGKLVARPSF